MEKPELVHGRYSCTRREIYCFYKLDTWLYFIFISISFSFYFISFLTVLIWLHYITYALISVNSTYMSFDDFDMTVRTCRILRTHPNWLCTNILFFLTFSLKINQDRFSEKIRLVYIVISLINNNWVLG